LRTYQFFDEDEEKIEEGVSDIVRTWGFDQEALDKWEVQNSRVCPCDSCEESLLVPLHGTRKRKYEGVCPGCSNRFLVHVEREGKSEAQVWFEKIEQDFAFLK
jgi:hypothetical protein